MRAAPTLRRLPLVLIAALAAACHDAPTDPLARGSGTGADRLLSDAELATPTDPSAAPSDAAWVSWVKSHREPIRSLTSTRFDDLRFLEPLLQGKRIVQLGESGHGVREFDQAKVRLIRYLHEELGYDVIAFESGLYDCWSANRQVATLTATNLMRHCIFGVWHTAEVLPLFQYIKETQSTAHPLTLAGFDIQASTVSENAGAPAFLESVIGRLDPDYAARIRQLDAMFVAGRTTFAQSDAGLQAVATYDSLTAWFDAHAQALSAAFAADPQPARVARQLAFSRARYLRHLRAQTSEELTSYRDPGMADNLDALLTSIHPGKKVIVWAHNYHIQADRGHSYENGDPSTGIATMGTWVAQRHASELYTVGLFMYRGTAADNARRVYQVSAPSPNSLEATFYPVRLKHFFVDLSQAGAGSGTEWIRRVTISKDWGVTPLLQVIGDQYHGILFIDTTAPPDYI
ncbi:MAG TPA: erythromycin esterase family protein [Longimicrobium sp.]